MRLKSYFKICILFFSLIVLSCSDDDAEELPCTPTSVSVIINGELQTFEAVGYGIDMVPGGHKLDLHFHKSPDANHPQRNLTLKMMYKRTGQNVIDEMIYSSYGSGTSVQVNFVNPDFGSNVTVNRSSCFAATFSGKVSAGGEELLFTDGKISYLYNNPLGEQ